MSGPFSVGGPALVSFSGGRTSAFMLRRMLDEGLCEDTHVVFADTGRERPETYNFVSEIARRWAVEVHWVQREGGFDKLLSDRGYLPNSMHRWCTGDLKIKPMQRWMQGRGYTWWTNVVGLRADEPHRVARMRSSEGPAWDYALPLADAGVDLARVSAFWEAQPFDLQLAPWEGNCDLCFLKGTEKKIRILQDRPELAAWWLEQEAKAGHTFRKEHDVASLVRRADARRAQTHLPLVPDSGEPVKLRATHTSRPPRKAKRAVDANATLFDLDDLGDCVCTD